MANGSYHPFFSIIIPVFNSALTLWRCMDSILSQDFHNYEVIFVDDGSSDSSWSILGDFALKDSRVSRFIQSNSGPSSARNKGLKEAKGEFVLFVDSDDYFFVNNALTIIYNTIVSNEGCELVYYAGAFVSSDGVFPDDSKLYKVYDFGYHCMEKNCLNSNGLVFGSISQQCFRRGLVFENNIWFNEQVFYGEDRLFVCTLFYYAKKTVEISDVIYCYVLNNVSLTHDEKKLHRQKSDILQVVFQLDRLVQGGSYKQPNLRKYIHGLYVQSSAGNSIDEFDKSLLLRNASTLKLLVKDLLFFLGLYNY